MCIVHYNLFAFDLNGYIKSNKENLIYTVVADCMTGGSGVNHMEYNH